MRLGKIALVALLFALPVSLAGAQEVLPDVLVKMVTEDVIAAIKQDAGRYSGNRAELIALVETKVVPHLNLEHITRLAVGKNWKNATPAQRDALVREFRQLLLNTYSTMLLNYRGNDIIFRPLRMSPGDTDVMVRAEVKQQGGQALTIDIDMEKTPEGWKVYDITVGGMSLVTTYRQTFSEEINRSGIDGLIQVLAEKNRRNAR